MSRLLNLRGIMMCTSFLPGFLFFMHATPSVLCPGKPKGSSLSFCGRLIAFCNCEISGKDRESEMRDFLDQAIRTHALGAKWDRKRKSNSKLLLC
jgi:hypothetical protein